MKKQALSILLALVIILSLAPLAHADEPALLTEFLPGAVLSAPGAPYLRIDVDGDGYNGDRIDMWITGAPELRRLAAAVDLWENQNPDAGSSAVGRLGVNGYNVRLQVDARIDGGAWQYNSDWDDFGFGKIEGTARGCFEAGRYVDIAKGYESFQLSTVSKGSSDDGKELGFLNDILIPFANERGDTQYHYDLANHSLGVRCRLVMYYDDLEGGERHLIFSDWGPETSIGKNGNQKDLDAPAGIEAPTLSGFTLSVKDGRDPEAEFFITIPQSVYEGEIYCDAVADIFEPYRLEGQIRIDGGEWVNFHITNPVWLFDSQRSAVPHSDYPFTADSNVEIRTRITNKLGQESPWSNIVGTAPSFTAHNWAKDELEDAAEKGLIPDCLQGADLTRPITRAEFAAVSVKLYEAMSGLAAQPAPADTFSDTADPEVLKAFALGVTNGTDTAKKTFTPDALINREQTAAMLTRVYKKLKLDGWTLETDASYSEAFKALFTMPALFSDDAEISGWAKDSVYFMAANGIVKGMDLEKNIFAPKLTENAGVTLNYATREQALLMSVRTLNNIG
ncbi:MAG: S-layer homology domain-containing protein [Oscillospiraceae bacterium]|jgi:hypothetical protein|nr:S-layer homology domain-containing protein [Oscillospiraceae bacterium]